MSARRRYRYNAETKEVEEVGIVDVKPRLQIMDDTPYRDLRPVLVGFKNDSNDPSQPHYMPQYRAIDSKTKHHEHMKENGLALAQDFEKTWEKAAEDRAAMATAKQDDKSIRDDLQKAMYRVFDAPGVEERPLMPGAGNDDSAFEGLPEPLNGGRAPHPNDTSYAVVTEYLPKKE